MLKLFVGFALGVLATLLAPAPMREYWSLRTRVMLGVTQDRAATQIHKLSMKYERKLEEQLNTSAGRREEEALGSRTDTTEPAAGVAREAEGTSAGVEAVETSTEGNSVEKTSE